MKKRTTQTEAGLRQIGALIVLVLALYSFSSSRDLSEIKPDDVNNVLVDQTNNSLNGSLKTGADALEKDAAKISEPKIEQKPSLNKSMTKSTPQSHDPSPSPLEFIVDMKNQNALFYYNEKSISPDHAIILIRDSKKIDLVAMHTGLKRPRVELSNAQYSGPDKQIIHIVKSSP